MNHDNNDKNYHDSNGKFKANNPGRPVGTKNRNAIKSFVLSQVDDLPTWFAGLDSDRERLDALIRLLPYAFPRLQATTDSEGIDLQSHDEIDLKKLSDEDLDILEQLQQKAKKI